VSRISLAATASYLPERWMTAAEVGERSSIPEQVIVEKFGLRGKHIAAEDEHVSDLSVRAAERLLAESGVERTTSTRSSSSRRAASPISSITETSARASCSTSATARSPVSS